MSEFSGLSDLGAKQEDRLVNRRPQRAGDLVWNVEPQDRKSVGASVTSGLFAGMRACAPTRLWTPPRDNAHPCR